MPMIEIVVLLAGALLGGFASGLTGFGYSLVALGLWLHVLPPQIAVPLSVLCSVASQALIIPQMWKSIEWRQAAPFIFAGLAGIPVGAEFLALIDAGSFKKALGLFLLGYAGVMLLVDISWTTRWGGEEADVGIGLVGGILGGFAGVSGAVMVVWAAIRGWGKDEKRGIFQAFNFTMLLVSGISHAWHGLHTRAVGLAVVLAVPISLVAANIGHRVYRRLSARRFDRVVLWLLLLAGVGLLLAPGR
jgi:uncharacterized protein